MDQDCLVKLQNCLSDIHVCMHNHFLKLNIKTDIMEISLYPSLMPKCLLIVHCFWMIIFIELSYSETSQKPKIYF